LGRYRIYSYTNGSGLKEVIVATYKNNGGEMVFPFLFDKAGNVLVVQAGDTFDAPDGLIVDGIEPVKAGKSKPVEDVIESVVD
jgi:hypothetical protein